VGLHRPCLGELAVHVTVHRHQVGPAKPSPHGGMMSNASDSRCLGSAGRDRFPVGLGVLKPPAGAAETLPIGGHPTLEGPVLADRFAVRLLPNVRTVPD
jgi:hypothetical protein